MVSLSNRNSKENGLRSPYCILVKDGKMDENFTQNVPLDSIGKEELIGGTQKKVKTFESISKDTNAIRCFSVTRLQKSLLIFTNFYEFIEFHENVREYRLRILTDVCNHDASE